MPATVIAFPGRRAVSDAERVQAAKAKCDAALAFDGDPSPENRERLIAAHRRLAEVRHAGVPGLSGDTSNCPPGDRRNCPPERRGFEGWGA